MPIYIVRLLQEQFTASLILYSQYLLEFKLFRKKKNMMVRQLSFRLLVTMIAIIGVLILNANMVNGLPYEEVVVPRITKQCPPEVKPQLTVCLSHSDCCSGYCYVPPKNFGLCY